MSKENVVKFYAKVHENDELKAEFKKLQNDLEKSDQIKNSNDLLQKIVDISKKYHYDFSKDELESYLKDLKSTLSDDELLNVSGGAMSPKIAAVGMLGLLGISFATGAAMKMSQFSSPTVSSQQEATLYNEDEDDNAEDNAYEGGDNSTENSTYAKDENGYVGTSGLSDSDLNESVPSFSADTNFRPSRKTVDIDDENLLKNLFNNNSVEKETPSLEVSTQQQGKVSPEQDSTQQPTITRREDKVVKGVHTDDVEEPKETAQVNSDLNNRDAKQIIAELQQQFEKEKQKLTRSIDSLQQQLDQNLQQLDSATKENELGKETIERLNEQNLALTEQLENLEFQIREINATTQGQLEAIQQLRGDNQYLVDQVNQVTNARNEHLRQIGKLREQLDRQNRAMEALSGQAVDGQNNLGQLREELRQTNEMLNSFKEKNEGLTRALEKRNAEMEGLRLRLQQQEDAEHEKEINAEHEKEIYAELEKEIYDLMNIDPYGEDGHTQPMGGVETNNHEADIDRTLTNWGLESTDENKVLAESLYKIATNELNAETQVFTLKLKEGANFEENDKKIFKFFKEYCKKRSLALERVIVFNANDKIVKTFDVNNEENDENNTTLDVNDVTAKNDSGWLMLTLPDGHNNITITSDNLNTFINKAGFSSINEVQYILVNNGNIKPTLDDDLKELFAEPETVKGRGYFFSYNNTIRQLTEIEKIFRQTNVQGVKKVKNCLELTLIDKSKNVTIEENSLKSLAVKAGFRSLDKVESIRFNNCDVRPELDENLSEIFKEAEDRNTLLHRTQQEIRDLKLQKIMEKASVSSPVAEIMLDENVGKEIAQIMHGHKVNKNVAELVNNGIDPNTAKIMDEFGVDEVAAIGIGKIAKATSSYTGQWIYVTLKDGNNTLTINKALLEYLAKQTGYKKLDDVKAIHVNNGSVIPTIADDLKDRFTIEDYSSSYKNVATRLGRNELSSKTLQENGIKKIRFNKEEQTVYITMNPDSNSLYLKKENINLLNYIENMINIDIKCVQVGYDEKELNEGGNEEIKIYLRLSTDDFCNGKVTFSVGEEVLNRQKSMMEKTSSDGNGNITVILKSDADELFEVNEEVIEYLQNQTKRFLQWGTTPLESLTVKKSDETAARIRVAQSIKDKYELVDGVLQAKN